MNNDIDEKEKVFCILNNKKEDINIQIQKSFIAYLEDLIKNSKKD